MLIWSNIRVFMHHFLEVEGKKRLIDAIFIKFYNQMKRVRLKYIMLTN